MKIYRFGGDSPLQDGETICELGRNEVFSASTQCKRTLSQTQLAMKGAARHVGFVEYPEQEPE